jgi:hypothetical protein
MARRTARCNAVESVCDSVSRLSALGASRYRKSLFPPKRRVAVDLALPDILFATRSSWNTADSAIAD